MNEFLKELKEVTNYTHTENGAIAHKSTLNKVYDLFAFGGAYRNRNNDDTITLFKSAYEENSVLAKKALFYLRDIRGGQGERRFFRVNFRWLCKNDVASARKLLQYLPEYGRYDDLWYTTEETELWDDMIDLIKKQLELDLASKTPSLLAKWLPSENTSSYATRQMASKIRKSLGMSHKDYRHMLALLRERIKVVEKLMSENRWNEIEFDKICSRAGLTYKNAFARRDITAKRYESFIQSKDTKVNASTLYPYQVVADALDCLDRWHDEIIANETQRQAVQKFWDNLPNYFEGAKFKNILTMIDTSGSMTGESKSAPINVAIGLGILAAQQLEGPFKNHYISFASRPQLIEIVGSDIVDQVRRIYSTNLVDNTNLIAAFDLLKRIALSSPEAAKALPDRLVVVSDMEIDSATSSWREEMVQWTMNSAKTEMERLREEWARVGLTLPKLVYWNVDARNNTILDCGDDVSFVSGMSPILFEQICKGVTGIDLMLDKLNSDRYSVIE
jgi:hypothetical protein